jgi:hypothetical protein
MNVAKVKNKLTVFSSTFFLVAVFAVLGTLLSRPIDL